jgi:hypothetical protein
MGLTEFVSSPEFNRSTRNATDSGVKLFFKGAEWTVKFVINFVKLMFTQMFK